MAKKDGKPGRFKQILETYRLTKRSDPRIGWILLGIFVGILAIFVILGFIFGLLIYLVPLGIATALLVATIVFGRRAEASAYSQIEGQPGAAGAVLRSLRSGWFVTEQPVALNKNQDCVWRVVGRPGVILVSEGPSTRVNQMLANERKRTARFVPEIEIIEIQSGNDEGQIRLPKLNRKVMKQKRNYKPAQVTEVRRRLEALAAQPMSAPKGPMPKSARAARGQRG
ncbi:MAG: DUF4191 domain-containing protein [Candidatus Nanopelagicales bacterium]